MQTADLIFDSVSGLMVDVDNVMIAYLQKWPVKILAKMSSKLCIIFYNIFLHKSRFFSEYFW